MSKEIGEVLLRFLWLLGQAFHVAFPLGMAVVIGVTLALGALALWKFPKDVEAKRRLPFLLILPVWWIFLEIWAAYFSYSWSSGQPQNPGWVSWPVELAVFVFGFSWVVLLLYLKGARIVTLLFGVWNLYFMLVMTLLAAMSVSGEWI